MLEKIKVERLDEVYYKEKLENGLDIIIIPKKGFSKTFAMFGTKYGSVNNDFTVDGKEYSMPEGIAHFLEHKMFDKVDEELFEEFEKLGASLNAYTNFGSTCYHFSTTDNVHKCIAKLLNFVQDLHLTDEKVEKEKGIIDQEIQMYNDESMMKCYFNALRAMYHNHPVRIDIAGTKESVYATTKEELQICYDTFYSTLNMVVVVVGDVDAKEIYDVILENIKPDFDKVSNISYPKIEEPKSIKQEVIEEKMDVSNSMFGIGFKDNYIVTDKKDMIKTEASTEILLDMLLGKSNDFYFEMFNQNLIDGSYNFDYSNGSDYSYVFVSGISKDPDKVYKKLKEHIEKFDINEEDFNRIKKKYIGENISIFDSIGKIGNYYIQYYFRDIDLFTYILEFNEVTLDDIKKRKKELFGDKQSVLSLVKPK